MEHSILEIASVLSATCFGLWAVISEARSSRAAEYRRARAAYTKAAESCLPALGHQYQIKVADQQPIFLFPNGYQFYMPKIHWNRGRPSLGLLNLAENWPEDLRDRSMAPPWAPFRLRSRKLVKHMNAVAGELFEKAPFEEQRWSVVNLVSSAARLMRAMAAERSLRLVGWILALGAMATALLAITAFFAGW